MEHNLTRSFFMNLLDIEIYVRGWDLIELPFNLLCISFDNLDADSNSILMITDKIDFSEELWVKRIAKF